MSLRSWLMLMQLLVQLLVVLAQIQMSRIGKWLRVHPGHVPSAAGSALEAARTAAGLPCPGAKTV